MHAFVLLLPRDHGMQEPDDEPQAQDEARGLGKSGDEHAERDPQSDIRQATNDL